MIQAEKDLRARLLDAVNAADGNVTPEHILMTILASAAGYAHRIEKVKDVEHIIDDAAMRVAAQLAMAGHFVSVPHSGFN